MMKELSNIVSCPGSRLIFNIIIIFAASHHLPEFQGLRGKGSRTKKKLADFETFAQIWVGGSGKNLI